MEIHNNLNEDKLFIKIKNKLGARKILLIILILFAIGSFGFGCIIYGAYLNKTSQTAVLKMFLLRVSELDFAFIPNYLKSTTADIENLSIDIKFKNWEKLRYFREKALIEGRIGNDLQEEISARIRYNNQTYRVGVSLTGMTNEHVRQPKKWSLAIKVKGDETIFGMKKFALLVPQSRGYLTDWIAAKLLKSQNIIGLRCDFVNVTINGSDHGIYYLEERYDKRLVENNHLREGIIFRADDYGSDIEVYRLKDINESAALSNQLTRLKLLWHGFLNGEIETNKLFDLEKFASFYVVSDLMNGKHALFFMNMRLYYNPVTGLVEPIGREWGYLRKETETEPSLSISQPGQHSQIDLRENQLLSKIFDSHIFEEQYINKADIITTPQYLDSILAINEKEFTSLIRKIHKQNPFYIFPIDILRKNQAFIREKLYPNLPPIKIYFNTLKNDSVLLFVENKIDLPIEIHSFIYNNKITITPGDRLVLESKGKITEPYQEVNFHFDDHFSNSPFSPDSVSVNYSLLGLHHIRKTILLPLEITSGYGSIINPPSQDPNLKKFSFLDVDDRNHQINFAEKDCELTEDLIIPQGYVVTAMPGCTIDLNNAAKVISYSPILFFGKTDSLITITSSDSTGQGIVVFNAGQTSHFSNVNFEYLSNSSGIGWGLTGAITFYESSTIFNHCLFKNNLRGDDYLNIIRADFSIQNTTFQNIMADAIDADFCSGEINNVEFLQPGNDAIDVSGTNLDVSEIIIIDAGDKGLSAGENSHLNCNNINIRGGEIAVASKDNSIIELNNITIISSKIAYCTYQKKSEFGAGKIVAKNSTTENVEMDYLVEIGSTFILNGESIDGKSEKVEEMLYGVAYGKSSR